MLKKVTKMKKQKVSLWEWLVCLSITAISLVVALININERPAYIFLIAMLFFILAGSWQITIYLRIKGLMATE